MADNDEALEWSGRWKRSDMGDDDGVAGELTYGDGRIRLALFQSLVDWSTIDTTSGINYPLDPAPTLPMIHGRSRRDLTILDATCQLPLMRGFEGHEQWMGQAIVESALAPSIDGAAPRFEGLRLSLLGLPVFARAPRPHLDWTTRGHVAVRAQRHELGLAQLASGDRVTLSQYAGWQHDDARQIVVTTPMHVEVRVATPDTWRGLIDAWLQPLQALLWLATGTRATVESLEIYVTDPRDSRRRGWTTLHVPLLEMRKGNRRTKPDLFEAMFYADELAGGFSAGMNRWMTLWTDLKHVLGPVHARTLASAGYANDRFFTACTAIEAYHRYCLAGDELMPRAEHRALVQRLRGVLNEADPDLTDWAVRAAGDSNRLPFRQRLTMIADHLPELSAALLGDRLADFAAAVTRARNGHAHALEGRQPLEEGLALQAAAEVLTWMLRTCLLIDLGFTPQTAQRRIMAHQGFRQTQQWMAGVLAGLGARDDETVDDE